MPDAVRQIAELHWMLEMLHNIDVGLVVLDRDYRVQAWNGFMENHSGLGAAQASGRSIFELFPDIPEAWLRHKAETVFTLNNRAFTIWEQRPYVFRFRNYRPITGTADFMYQNTTLIPLQDPHGEISHLALIVYDVTDIATSRQALTAANAQLEQLSRTDRLTGLFNRGYWEECLGREFRRFQRTGQKVTLVMFDIDHFKQINDQHGHLAGDEVIRTVAQLLHRTLRDTDFAGRYGGDEFGVLLVNTDGSSGLYFAERLRRAVAKEGVRHGPESLRFTISLGVAALEPGLESPQKWLAAADQALYQSKLAGRDHAFLFEHEPS